MGRDSNSQFSAVQHSLSVAIGRAWRFGLRSLLTLITTVGFVSLVFAQTSGHLRGTNTGGGATTPAYPGTTGGFVIHTFTSNGTFTPPPGVSSVDVLIVGGGGGGGRGNGTNAGGGGGGGEMRQLTGVGVTPGAAVNVVVGAGGAGRTGSAGAGNQGSTSSFGANNAIGGGAGGAGATSTAAAAGGNGGSGGGGGSGNSNNENGAGGTSTATTAQGDGGTGNGRNNGGQRAGGGGGGAALGAAGDGGAASSSQGGAGGPGRASSYSGASVTYAGGGGGSGSSAGAGGTGGGTAGADGGNAASAAANTGAGAGGSRGGNGGNGGSGIVIVRYQPPVMNVQQEPPLTVTNGATFTGTPGNQPQVRILTAGGAPVANVVVSVTDGAGAPTLSGTLTATTNGSGIATFTDLTLTNNGSDTLIFSVAGAGTNQVTSRSVTVQTPSQNLTVNTQPSATGQSGVVLAQAPVILANNGSNVAGVNVTVSIGSGGDVNSTLGGTTTVATNGSGLATFSNLVINGIPGNYVLNFTAPGWAQVNANAVTVSEPPLQINQQPSASVDTGIAFAQQPQILVENVYGSPVQNVTVTASIASGDAGATLGGTLTAVTNASGIATFTNLAITGAAGNYTLAFNAPTWSAVTSATVTVEPAPALVINTAPSTAAQNGLPLEVQPVILASDGGAVSGLQVTVTLVPDSTASLSGTTTVTTTGSGLAAFTDLEINGDPGSYVLRFSAPGWEPVDSANITLSVPNLVIQTQPSATAFSAVAFGQQPVIQVQNVYGDPVQNVTVTASLASGGGTLGGTTSALSDASGLASFGNLQISGSGNHTLQFAATDYSAVVSNTINVSLPPASCAFEGGLQGSQIVEVLACTEVQVSGATAINVPAPVGISNGDLLIAAFSSNGNGTTISAPAGWTNISPSAGHGGGAPNSRQNLSIWSRVVDGSETTPFAFTSSQAQDTYAWMTRYGNSNGTTLQATAVVSSGTNAVAPALTTNTADSLVVRFAAVNGAGSMTANPGNGQVISGLRNITQNVSGDSWGASAYGNQPVAGGTGTAAFTNGNSNWVTQTVAIEPVPVLNYFEVTHANTYALCLAGPTITLTVRDLQGNIDSDFEGVVTITNDADTGDFAVVSGFPGNFSNAGNGSATYEFVTADTGSVQLTFTDTVANASLNFDANSGLIGTENYLGPMQVGACTFTIEHQVQGGVCAPSPITVTVLGPASTPVNYVGTVTVTSTPGTGNWSNAFAAPGIFSNGTAGNGTATFTFVEANAGQVQLGYTNVAGNYTFSVSANAGNVNGISANDGQLTVSACSFRIFLPGNVTALDSSVCRVEEVRIQVVNASATIIPYTGTINLSTVGTTTGDWSKTGVAADAFGTLTSGPGDGSASYPFQVTDAGEITLDFAVQSDETINFNIVAANVAQPSGNFDPTINYQDCVFRVEFASGATSDVCSIAQVDITIVDRNGIAVDDYEGQVQLSTSTGFGSWEEIGLSDDVLTDAFAEDGFATYNFVDSDDGTISLGFRHRRGSGPVNINVTDGVSQDPGNSANMYDQNLQIELCTFEIVLPEAESNACTITEVQFNVRDRNNQLASNFEGVMRITNNAGRGDWFENSGSFNALPAPSGADAGVADYTFTAGTGQVTLVFSSESPAQYNFNVVDDEGLIIEAPSADPTLFYTGCFPQIFAGPVCTDRSAAPTNLASVAIPAASPIAGTDSRMVLMTTHQIEDIGSANTGTSATYNSAAMSLVKRQFNGVGPYPDDVTVEMWAIFGSDLPAGAGTYQGVFSGGAAGTSTTICLTSVTGVAQELPVEAANPQTGPLNGTNYSDPVVDGEFRHDAETTISTQSNNSFVYSVTANDTQNGAGDAIYYYLATQPNPLVGLWGGYDTGQINPPPRTAELQARPNNGRSGGSAGVLSALGVITVVEPFRSGESKDVNIEPTRNAHIVAAFKPRVEGIPLATDFDPVILYKTFSGAISYRAIGASLRDEFSDPTVNAALDCSFVDFAVGTQAPLTMPANSSVRAAYLYWAGQGSPAQVDDTVTFGRVGDPEFQVVADEVFNIIGASTEEVDFFAAYADVTELVDTNGDYRVRNFAVSSTGNWDNNATCAAGWSLVVIYDNNDEQLRVVNLFHGFQPFQWASFTLVPRNFRMATYDNSRYLPNGQVTHFTLEGDETLNNGDESLGIQDQPNSVVFNNMSQEHLNSYNPINNEFNGTIARPIFELYDNGVDPPFYSWIGKDPSLITNSQNDDGYQIDFAGPDAQLSGRTGNRIGNNPGVDVDTHYLGNDTLFDFSQPGQEAERITTRYSSGQDLVLLVSEVISVTNFPIADIEVFLSQTGDFKVNGEGSYQLTVTNNGDGTSTGGDATGVVTVAMQMPTGMTFSSAGQVSGTGWSCVVDVAPANGAFTCTYNIGTVTPLASGASLPALDINVDVSGPDVFTLNENDRTVTARAVHTGGNCATTTTGLVPLESNCDRSPQFDNKYDLQGGAIDPNTVTAKTDSNNNVASVLTTVQGIRTDLRIVKSLVDTLEVDQAGQYQLVVTNLGPDDTTVPFTISDAQPAGITFTGTSSTDPEWSCSTLTPTLNCQFNGTLALNASTTLLLDVLVTGSARATVVNTAQVVVGSGNFDTVQSNNTSTNSSTIVGPPVASQERFLMSVSTPGNDTSIGGLNNFENHDLIIYDPQTDEAVMFFDDSLTNGGRIDDINAVHLLKNGHIILSANGTSTIGTNNLTFEPWDLVRYDPITGEAFMFLQGSTVFDNFQSVNINGVYVNDDCPTSTNHAGCTVLLSTTGGGTTSFDNLAFTSSDIIALDRSGANVTASVYLEGSDNDVFGATEGNGGVDIDAFYVRVDPNNPTLTVDTLALSVDNETATIGADPGMDPVDGTIVTRDDVTELNRTANTTQNLFLGDQELGVFTPDVLTQPTAADRRLDALHLVEDGYHGHFSVRVVQAGSVCAFALVRISKHDGLTHNRDTDYYGSVRIATSTGIGNWSTHTGAQGSLNNGTLDDGAAIYQFVPADNGTVVLRLSYDQAATIKVTATNGIATVLASESPNFVFNQELTPITWKDLFNTVSYSRNDGTRNWSGNWIEVDGESATTGAGPAAGNVRVINDINNIPGHQKLRLRSNSYAVNNSIQPSLARTFNLAAVPATEAVILSFDYNFTGVAAADQVVVEARGTTTNDPAWTQLASYTSNNATGSGSASLNLTTALGGNSNMTSTSQIRFRIANGYAVTGRFFIDNVSVATATNECGFTGTGSLDHYAISHSGFGISCVGTPVTITAHDAANDPIDANGETISLSISPAKGVWARVLSGGGTLTPIASQTDNGIATYTFPSGENAVSLLLNYTVPAGSSTPVNINVLGQSSAAVELEDPTLQIAEAGLVFYNETQDNYTIGTQIAGKPSNVAPLGHLLTVQGVRSSDQNPLQCVPLFAAGQTLPIEIAAECNDADSCVSGESFSVNGETVSLVDNNGGAGASAYTEIDLDFITQPSGDIGATIELNYSDVGIMQLHSRYNIPFGFFGATNPITANPITPNNPLTPPGVSGDYMIGASNLFVVRPFGFAINFPGNLGNDRTNTAGGLLAGNFDDRAGNPADSLAVDDDGTVFVYAGEGFDTVVTAMGWQAVDDNSFDGQPDVGANLYDNRPTPNFFYDTVGAADNYAVKLTVLENQAEALGGVRGELSNDTLTFNNFDNFGVAATGSASMSYDEVGVIDIQAQLVDNSDSPLAYRGTDVIRGVVNDVGRFYPRRFDVLTTMLLPRIDASCVPPSIFTYMDEPFAIELELVARNTQGVTTVNYRGGFAKLAEYADLNFRAIEEVTSADNNDLSARLDNVSVPVTFESNWSAVQGGELVLEGNLAFSRANPADPDGPYEDLKIAFVPIDSDGVTLDPNDLDTEITQATPEYSLIAEHDFRYGRLLINNAFGPETEDLAITFRVEYFDGERFVVNTDDSCTVIDAADLTLVPGTYTGNLDDGETAIVTPQTTEFHDGQVQGVEAATNPSDETFTATAPGEGNGGTVDVELDLDALGLPFLQFRWPEINADYNENPRAQLEFGQFRSHDRVIHWQEIYNGPTPP
jgi:hypothetical protein